LSISKVHELIQNKGCVWTVSILMILSMVAGSFVMCGGPGSYGGPQTAEAGNVVAKVGEHEITDRLIQGELERNSAMFGGLQNIPPADQLQLQAGTLRGMIASALQLDMAKKYGIVATDEDIEKLVAQNIEQELSQLKMQYMMQNKLKPEATEAEFAELFKKEQGKDLAQAKKEAVERNAQMLKASPDLRLPLAALAIGQPLLTAIKKDVKLTDEELKKSYDSFVFKRITLSKGDATATARKVVDELKGGLSFEQAMDRYTESPADPKQKASAKTEPHSRTELRGFDAYAPLENLKPGQVSDPITIGQSVNIFKLVEIKNELPKDFEKKKEEYRDTQATSVAAAKLQNDLQAAQKTAQITWQSEVYKQLYQYGRVLAENLTPDERAKLEAEIMKESVRLATEGDPQHAKVAATLAFVSFRNAYEKATAEERKKLDEQKADIYEVYLNDNEDPALRMELVAMYFSEKKGPEFFNQLMAAANGNLSLSDEKGQATFSQINQYISRGKEAKLLDSEQVKQLQEVQKLWVEQKADMDKAAAEAAKAEAQARKEAEEADKKARAEAAGKVKTREELEKEKTGAGSGKK